MGSRCIHIIQGLVIFAYWCKCQMDLDSNYYCSFHIAIVCKIAISFQYDVEFIEMKKRGNILFLATGINKYIHTTEMPINKNFIWTQICKKKFP